MKTTVKNTVIGLFTFVAIIAVNVANATTTEEVTPAAELKLITHIDAQPVFQLSLNNAQNEKFFVIVKDEFGTVVYEETVSGINIKRKYQLNTEELGTVGLTFEIVSMSNTKPVVFSVQNSSRITKETLIVKK
jgi:tellurite resistance protein